MAVIKYEHLRPNLAAVESSALRGCFALALLVAALCRELAALPVLLLLVNIYLLQLVERFSHFGREDGADMDLCDLHRWVFFE